MKKNEEYRTIVDALLRLVALLGVAGWFGSAGWKAAVSADGWNFIVFASGAFVIPLVFAYAGLQYFVAELDALYPKTLKIPQTESRLKRYSSSAIGITLCLLIVSILMNNFLSSATDAIETAPASAVSN
jgi:hypothetical protein